MTTTKTPAKKTPITKLSLAGRPPVEVGVIIAAIACGVIILAVFAEWILSGKGLIGQRRAGGDESADE